MLKSRPIVAEDIVKIFNKPWYATAEDIVANDLDILPKKELYNKILIEYSEHLGLAIYDSEQPDKTLIILGARPQENEQDIWWTWFFAAYDFQERWRELTAFTKEIFEEQAILKGAKEVRAYSPQGNKPEGVYWFKKLGFHKVQDFVITMNNGYNIYMFQRFFN